MYLWQRQGVYLSVQSDLHWCKTTYWEVGKLRFVIIIVTTIQVANGLDRLVTLLPLYDVKINYQQPQLYAENGPKTRIRAANKVLLTCLSGLRPKFLKPAIMKGIRWSIRWLVEPPLFCSCSLVRMNKTLPYLLSYELWKIVFFLSVPFRKVLAF